MRLAVPLMAVVLLSAAPARAALSLVETVTVDPAAKTAEIGTKTLQKGTRYELEVSGTFDVTNTEAHVTLIDDAIYCFDGRGFSDPPCPHSGSNDSNHRDDNFRIGVDTDPRWGPIDGFDTPTNPGNDATHQQFYDDSHSYRVGFYPPATGKLKAGGLFVFQDCSSCTTSVSGGPITIDVFGPAPKNSGGGDVGCNAGRMIAARAKYCPFGKIATKAVPAPDTTTRIDSATLPPKTEKVAVVAQLSDATAEDMAMAVLMARFWESDKFQDLLDGCLIIGGVDPDSEAQFFHPVAGACLILVSRIMAKSRGRRAHAAAVRPCHIHFVPIWRKGTHPSASEKRRIYKLALGKLRGSCSQPATGRIAVTLAAHGRGTTLNKLLGTSVRAGLGRTAPAGSKDGPNAKLRFSWGRSIG